MASNFGGLRSLNEKPGYALMVFDLAALVRRAFVVFLLLYVGVRFGCSGPFLLVVPFVLVVLSAFVLEPRVRSICSLWREASWLLVLGAIARGSASHWCRFLRSKPASTLPDFSHLFLLC